MGNRIAKSPTPRNDTNVSFRQLPTPSTPAPRWAVWLATGLGVGRLPLMPGTYGSALGVAVYLGLAALANRTAYPRLGLCAAAVALTGSSLFLISVALRSFLEEDPPAIVLDEVAGQVLALLPLPLAAPATNSYWEAVAAGFLLFRSLDSIKPYPISKLERLEGPWGILADDIGAALVAAVLLWGLLHLWSPF